MICDSLSNHTMQPTDGRRYEQIYFVRELQCCEGSAPARLKRVAELIFVRRFPPDVSH